MLSLLNLESQRTIDEEISWREDAIRVNEAAIRAHKAAILVLKTRRNTFSPISKLPNELLSTVFLDSKKAFQDMTHGERSKGGWLNVAGVSRHWRDVTLNTPRLWRNIKLSQGDAALEMLKRSKSAPLEIECLGPTYDCEHWQCRTVAQTSMLEISRIQKVEIAANDSASLVEFLRLNSKSSAPALESLSLQLYTLWPHPTVPKDVLWRDMPALRTLTLHPIFASAELPFLPRLSKFTLLPFDFESANVPLSWFIQSFRNTPNLEDFNISGVAYDEVPSAQVPLRKLRRLSLVTHDLGASKLFSCLDYPGSASVKFYCHSREEVDSGRITGLHAAASRFAMAEEAASVREVMIRADGRFVVKFFILSDGQFDAFFDLVLPGSSQATPHYLQLLPSFPIAKAPMLHLTFIDDLDVSHQVVRLIPSFERLKTFKLYHSRSDLLSGLLKADEAADKPPCPELETIVIESREFGFGPMEPNVELCRTLFQTVQERIRHGMPLQLLRIKDQCNIPREVIWKLEQYVAVEWDGYGRENLVRSTPEISAIIENLEDAV